MLRSVSEGIRDWIQWFAYWLASALVSLLGVWIVAVLEAHAGREAFALPLQSGAFYLFAVVIAARSGGEYLYRAARQARAYGSYGAILIRGETPSDVPMPPPSEAMNIFVWVFLIGIVGIIGALYIDVLRAGVQSDKEWLWATSCALAGTVYSFICSMVVRYLG
jgi:hypothetical protein